MTGREVMVVAARRTPFGRVGGALRRAEVTDLAATVIAAVLADAAVKPADVGEVALGNCWGPGGNPARIAALAAGLDVSVPAFTVDQQCASGLAAVVLAAARIRSGAVDVAVAGGAESVSTAPWRLRRPATLYGTPVVEDRARFAPDTVGDPDMGPAADLLARDAGVSRDRQDLFAAGSHRATLAARQDGSLAREIVPVGPGGAQASAGSAVVDTDELVRPRLTVEALSRLSPVFSPDGTVTAGNAASAADGAALVVLVSGGVHERLGRPPALRVLADGFGGVDPQRPGLGPVEAIRALAGHDAATADRVEIVEAYAGQVLACVDALGIDEHRVNPDGGALAIGHPWGASGAVPLVRLFHAPPAARAAQRSVAAVAGAGGVGAAMLVERV